MLEFLCVELEKQEAVSMLSLAIFQFNEPVLELYNSEFENAFSRIHSCTLCA